MNLDRLPWFQCYPGLLLGAVAEMSTEEGYFYMVVLMRIYEVRGPIPDKIEAIARRCNMTVRCAKKCQASLLESGKLITADGMIMNPHAEKFLSGEDEKKIERKIKAKSAASVRWEKPKGKQQNGDADASGEHNEGDAQSDAKPMLGDATKTKSKKEEEKPGKKNARADRATRIPDDWKMTPEMGNYGRGRGLTSREVLNEADKFVRYWKGVAGQKGRKLDWKATWEKWCINAAERLGRMPRDHVPEQPKKPEEFDRKYWEFVAMMYRTTSNWQKSWGPEPGPGCVMPQDLLAEFQVPA